MILIALIIYAFCTYVLTLKCIVNFQIQISIWLNADIQYLIVYFNYSKSTLESVRVPGVHARAPRHPCVLRVQLMCLIAQERSCCVVRCAHSGWNQTGRSAEVLPSHSDLQEESARPGTPCLHPARLPDPLLHSPPLVAGGILSSTPLFTLPSSP